MVFFDERSRSQATSLPALPNIGGTDDGPRSQRLSGWEPGRGTDGHPVSRRRDAPNDAIQADTSCAVPERVTRSSDIAPSDDRPACLPTTEHGPRADRPFAMPATWNGASAGELPYRARDHRERLDRARSVVGGEVRRGAYGGRTSSGTTWALQSRAGRRGSSRAGRSRPRVAVEKFGFHLRRSRFGSTRFHPQAWRRRAPCRAEEIVDHSG